MAEKWIMETEKGRNILKGYIGHEKHLEIPEGITDIGAASRFRITYVGPSYQFQDLTKVVLRREVHSEGDYHHPSGSHFSVAEIHTCGHLFGSAADGDFLCEVYCQEDRQTLQYPAQAEQIWTEQC